MTTNKYSQSFFDQLHLSPLPWWGWLFWLQLVFIFIWAGLLLYVRYKRKKLRSSEADADERTLPVDESVGAAPRHRKKQLPPGVRYSLFFFQLGAFVLTIIGLVSIPSPPDTALTAHTFNIWGKLNEAMLIATFVSLIFDLAYHAETFGDPVEDIQERVGEAQKHVDSLNSQISTLASQLTKQITSLTDLLGYDYESFQSMAINAFKGATQRIIVASNIWNIDEAWWRSPNGWDNLPLANNLFIALKHACMHPTAAGDVPLEVKLTGNAPTPTVPFDTNSTYVAFTEHEFERFLGVMWHCVVAHKVRERVRQDEDVKRQARSVKQIPLVVLVAPTPLSATVIDNVVWTVVSNDNSFTAKEARAFELTKNLPTTDKAKLADIYGELLHRYTRYTRSAREYVESTLMLTLQMLRDITYLSPIQDTPRWTPAYKTILDSLGMQGWLTRYDGSHSTSCQAMEEAAIILLREFLHSLQSAAQFKLLSKRPDQREHKSPADPAAFGDMFGDLL